MQSKKCNKCNEVKTLDQFSKRSRKGVGVQYQCKECRRKYYLENKHRTCKLDKLYYNSNKKRYAYTHKRWALLNTYGLSEEDYRSMKASQQNRCAICGIECATLCIDHDHETKKIRELLCSNCNTGIGLFKENIETFNKAINYIIKHKEIK